MADIGRTILNALAALLFAGAFLFPYVGGSVTAYVLVGLSILLILWNFFNPVRFAPDPGSWMFLIAWALIAIAFALTNLPGRKDFLLALNFAMFALYPLIAGALQRLAKPGNSAAVANLALVGSFVALALGSFQVFMQHYDRAEGYASNPIASATAALFLGFLSLLGLFSIKSTWRYIFLLGPIAGLITVLLAQSRGPLIALPALVVIALVMVPIRRALTVGAVAILIIAAGVLAVVKPSVFGRIESLPTIVEDLATGQPVPYSVDGSGNIRYRILMGSLAAFKDSPWLGYGWYMKTPVVAKYIKDPVGFQDPRVAHLHSDILDLAVSGGIVGLIAYMLALLAPIVSAVTSPRDSQFKGRLFLALTLSVGFLCCGAVNLLFGFEFMTTMYVVLAAIFIGYCRDAPALVAS